MTCTIEGCDLDNYALQMCHRHYMQDYRKRSNKKLTYDMADIKAWLLTLERERYDTSYKTRPTYEAPTRPATSQGQKQRDQTMYHYGRYSAGIRDKLAIKASKEVSRYIGENK